MKLDQNSSHRLFNKENMFFPEGAVPGWFGVAPEYSGWKDEQVSWKTDCYIGDWTLCLDELRIKGPDALKFLSAITTNSLEKFSIGQAKHYVQCNENGKIMAEGVLFRLNEDEFLLESNVSWANYLFARSKGKYNATAKIAEVRSYRSGSIAADWFKIQVSGPKSIYLVERITGQSLRDVKFMHFAPVEINGHKCIALRQGMAGEIGFEIQGPIEFGLEIYEALFAAGEEFNCRRLGSRNAMINHLEACFPTFAVHYISPVEQDYADYLNEIGSWFYTGAFSGSYDGDYDGLTFSPYELGWNSCVKFDHDFIGRQALEKEAGNVKKKVVTLEFNKEDMLDIYASHFETDQEPFEAFEMPMNVNCQVQADKVLNEKGEMIGIATTPGYSYYFRKILALTFIDVEYSTPGTEVTILWGSPGKRQKLVRATVAPAPYKTDNRRANLKNV